jgi:hypothetical protein
VGEIVLPAGRAIVPDAGFASGEPVEVPVIWVAEQTSADTGALWRRLADAFPGTGLWPLVLTSLDGDGARPWFDGELDAGAGSSPDGKEATALLADWWSACSGGGDEDALRLLRPFGRAFPGMAPATPDAPASPAAPAEAALSLAVDGHLGLAAVTRPSDVPWAVGWTGPVNHHSDIGELCAVLRSWEERFGAYLVGVGFDTLTLGVERPPSTAPQALAVAAEHFAACPDNVWQGAGALEAYAADLVGSPVWSFWWD